MGGNWNSNYFRADLRGRLMWALWLMILQLPITDATCGTKSNRVEQSCLATLGWKFVLFFFLNPNTWTMTTMQFSEPIRARISGWTQTAESRHTAFMIVSKPGRWLRL